MEREKLIAIVTAAQDGDGDALNELFNSFYNDVYFFALKTVKDEDTACDITQESFIEIINTIGDLREPAAFVTWMKKITYHQCTRYFKKKKDVLVEEDEDGNSIFDIQQEERTEFIPDEALDQKDFRETILAMLDTLSPEQRAATIMYYYDEMSVKQIAEVQGVSEGTVKSRLNYARKSIKTSVETYEKKNNVKLHSVGLLPLVYWLFVSGSQGAIMPVKAADATAAGISAATGTTLSVTGMAAEAGAVAGGVAATGAFATGTAAAGIAAKVTAIPFAAKVAAAVLAGTVFIGGAGVAVGGSTATEPTATSPVIQVFEPIESISQTEADHTLPTTIPIGTETWETTMPSTNPAETEHEEITSPSTTPAETNQTETDVPEKSESVSLPYVEPIAPGTTGSIEALIPDTTDPVSNPVETTPAASEPAETESNHIHEYAISQQTPTCTANGGTYYYCECGDFYIENEIEAYGHLYMSDVIDPTETEYGYTEYRCMYCMHGYRDNYTNPTGTSVPEDGHVHSYVEFMVQEPTCTEYGRIEYTCECGAVSGSEQVEPYGHDYDCIPVVVVPPTETEQGYTEHECIICGDIYRDSYTDYTVPVETESPATETTDHKHIYKHVGEVVDICATVGNVEYICECGDILWVPGGHHYGVTIIPPTETEQGYTEYDCVICGYTYRDSYTDPTG